MYIKQNKKTCTILCVLVVEKNVGGPEIQFPNLVSLSRALIAAVSREDSRAVKLWSVFKCLLFQWNLYASL